MTVKEELKGAGSASMTHKNSWVNIVTVVRKGGCQGPEDNVGTRSVRAHLFRDPGRKHSCLILVYLRSYLI